MDTRIPAPRVPLVDPATGITDRVWFTFFRVLYESTGISASFLTHTKNVASNYSPTENDWHLFCTGTVVVTLPASANRAKELVVTNAGSGVVTLLPNGTEKINGNATMTIDFQWTTLQLRPVVGGYIIQ